MKVLDMDVFLDHIIKMLEKNRQTWGVPHGENAKSFSREEHFYWRAIPNPKSDTNCFQTFSPNYPRLLNGTSSTGKNRDAQHVSILLSLISSNFNEIRPFFLLLLDLVM